MSKKILLFLGAAVICLGILLLFSSNETEAKTSGFCFMCSSSSSCNYCVPPSGKDTSSSREWCKKKGCEITGYTTCSGAANYKYCH